jgi:hypothetical protein
MKLSPSALSAIAMPPEAVPVSPASAFMAMVNETSGPPSIERTASVTVANAGRAPTTEPKPTRLLTVSSGKTDAMAPASRDCRTFGSRRQLTMTIVRQPAASASTTDQTPATSWNLIPPQASSCRKEKSRRGSTTRDIRKFTTMTTASGNTARKKVGSLAAILPCVSSAGSKSPAAVA